MSIILNLVYFVAAMLFIVGLKQMSHPKTARRGIIWAGIGMLAAIAITYVDASSQWILMTLALLIGGVLAAWFARRVAMTDMPQMVALYNGMGGGSAACIAALALNTGDHSMTAHVLAILGALIGSISFSGSLIAYAKLQGLLDRAFVFKNQQFINFILFGATLLLGIAILLLPPPQATLLVLFFLLALAYGVAMTLPIGGADMPVVISLYNALTGLAVAFEGFVLNNPAMIIAGTVVGAAGTLLTRLMAQAMNRSLGNVLFSAFGATTGGAAATDVEGEMKEISALDAAALMSYARSIVIIPGYGMAVAQAQHKLWELTGLLEKRGLQVRFAIHPVAGRMPGHMNVLLAEAGVPYDKIHDMEDINNDFPNTDIALVIGANDVVNPDARSNQQSPIYGMPILDADRAQNCIVIKRGRGKGFSGIENQLFYADNTRMLYGDGQQAVAALIQNVKEM